MFRSQKTMSVRRCILTRKNPSIHNTCGRLTNFLQFLRISYNSCVCSQYVRTPYDVTLRIQAQDIRKDTTGTSYGTPKELARTSQGAGGYVRRSYDVSTVSLRCPHGVRVMPVRSIKCYRTMSVQISYDIRTNILRSSQ